MLGLLVVFRNLFRAVRRGWKDPAFRGLLVLTVVLLVAGMFFYRRVEHWTLLEALYFSVITLTTVGYGDFSPQTRIGRGFTVFYVLIGLGIVIALITQIATHAARIQTERIEDRRRRQGTPLPSEGPDDG